MRQHRVDSIALPDDLFSARDEWAVTKRRVLAWNVA